MDVGRPAPGIHTFFIEGECVLLSEPRQEIHVLNHSAAFIWCHLQAGSPASIAEELRKNFGLSDREAATFVETAFTDWRARGFLAGSPVVDAPAAITASQEPLHLPPYFPPAFAAEGFYTLLNSRLNIRFTAPEQKTLVDPVLAHLRNTAQDANTILDVVQSDSGIVLYRDGESCASCRSLDELTPLVKGLVWSTAINQLDFFIGLHAGVIGEAANCLLLSGKSGSGKSTLTAALMHAGYQYFSDEFALLRRGDLRVLPVPLALCVKDTGIEALARYFPGLRELPLHTRFDGKRVAYMPPPGDSLPPVDAAPRARAVIFPRYVVGAKTVCRAVSKAEALRRLMEECLVVRQRLGPHNIRALIEWIDGLACLELDFGTVEDGVSIIRTILHDTRRGGPARHAET